MTFSVNSIEVIAQQNAGRFFNQSLVYRSEGYVELLRSESVFLKEGFSGPLAFNLLFADYISDQDDHIGSLSTSAPAIVEHSLRQSKAVRTIMPIVLKYARLNDSAIFDHGNLPWFQHVVAAADCGLIGVDHASREFVWNYGPKPSKVHRNEYQLHPKHGLLQALNLVNESNQDERLLALSIGRHHMVQPNHEYGLKWCEIDEILTSRQMRPTDNGEKQLVDQAIIYQTAFDSLDDTLTRQTQTELAELLTRTALFLSKLARVMTNFIHGDNGAVDSSQDQNESAVMLLIYAELYRVFYDKDSELHQMYDEVWQATRLKTPTKKHN